MIRINGKLTDCLVSNNGVRQGDNQSPTIFCLYINDLLDTLNGKGKGVKLMEGLEITCLAYADDIVIVSESDENLQSLLNTLHEWCCNWRMLINTSKTKILHFRKCGVNETHYSFKIGNNELEKVNNYKYLGVRLSCHGDNEKLVEELASAGSRSLGNLIGKTKSNLELGYQSFTKLVEACVFPVLDNGSGAWSTGVNYSKIDKVEHRAIRYFCGLPKNCSILGMTGDMGWTPSMVQRDIENVRLYNQLIKMSED